MIRILITVYDYGLNAATNCEVPVRKTFKQVDVDCAELEKVLTENGNWATAHIAGWEKMP